MCGYLFIGCIDFMLAGKKMTYYTSLFSSHDFKKNNNIILIVLSATSREYQLFHLQVLFVHQLELQVQALLFSQTTGIV